MILVRGTERGEGKGKKERGKEGEKEGKGGRGRDEREKHLLIASHTHPSQELNPQPGNLKFPRYYPEQLIFLSNPHYFICKMSIIKQSNLVQLFFDNLLFKTFYKAST